MHFINVRSNTVDYELRYVPRIRQQTVARVYYSSTWIEVSRFVRAAFFRIDCSLIVISFSNRIDGQSDSVLSPQTSAAEVLMSECIVPLIEKAVANADALVTESAHSYF